MTTESREQQNRALAFLVHAERPDWGEPGIMAALRKLEHRPLVDVVHAAMNATSRTDQNTPAFISFAGEHWRQSPRSEPTSTPDNRRSDNTCAGCSKSRMAHDRMNELTPESRHEWITVAEMEKQTRDRTRRWPGAQP